MHRSRLLAVLVVFAPLAACSTPDLNDIAQSCPSTAILAQAAEVIKVRPGGQAREDVIVQAEMLTPTIACDYELGDPEVSVDISLPIVVRRGPAAGEAQALQYFVAVMGPNGAMVSKRLFQRNVAGDAPTATVTDFVNGTVIGLQQNQLPYQYRIVVGFQLTPDEFARNQGETIFRP